MTRCHGCDRPIRLVFITSDDIELSKERAVEVP